MKKLIQKLDGKSIADLAKDEIKLRGDLAKLILERVVNPGKDTNLISKKKRELAQILTIMNVKKEKESIEKLTVKIKSDEVKNIKK